MSFLSRIFFTQAKNLIDVSAQRELNANDKIELPPHISAYKSDWNESVIDWSSGKSIYISIFKSAKPLILTCIFFQVVASLFSFSAPIFINQFITHLQLLNEGSLAWNESNIWLMIFFAVGLGLSGAGHGLLIQHYFYQTLVFFQKSTNIVNRKIYEHALRISNKTKQEKQIGEIVNLMSSDADAIGDSAITTIDLSNAVLLLIGGSALLFYYMGWSALVAVLVMVTLIPLTQNLAKKFMYLEDDMLRHRDHRLSVMAQVLNAIRVVKYFVWEESIKKEVNEIREKEISSRLKLNKAEILWGLIYTSISSIVLFSALFTHYLRGKEINLALVMTCISVFSVMEDQFGGLSRFISRFINIFVSGKRISDFLKSESLDVFSMQRLSTKENCLRLKDISLHYGHQQFEIFNKISFDIQKGKSAAIVGAVGSGKTSLLQIILNELQTSSGLIYIPQDWKIAYQSQEPFIINTTLYENIVFGQKNKTQIDMQKAIDLSCLSADLKLFPHGLQTEIGEKGVNLSGGQKQRVSIARCILSDADFIVMDDPLSAVDVNTESLLCKNLIFGEWKNKTRLIATHRISHLHLFDEILFLYEGKIIKGTYTELLNFSEQFKKFIDLEKKNQQDEKDIQIAHGIGEAQLSDFGSSRITVDEDKAVGSVEKSIYKSYFLALGGSSKYRKWIVLILLLSAFFAVLAPLAQKAWITQYSSLVDSAVLVYVYGLIGLAVMLVTYVSGYLWMKQGIAAGRAFHDNALNSILKTDIRFFDSTPIGRILQRFSRDVESVDIHLPWSVDSTMNSFLQVLVAFLLIIITLPLSIVFLVPVMIYYYFIQNSYRRVAREVKRFDSLARSPRYSHFKETLQGLSVIRSFNKQEYFLNEFLKKLQDSTQAFYTHYFVNRWFSTRLPLIGAAISLCTVLLIVYASYHKWISPGIAGLVTIYALQFWRYLNWGIRIFSDLESRMTAVERLSFYAHLSQEKEYNQNSQILPLTGRLEFKDVKLRYAPHLPWVLNGVSFEIKSGDKVGIVGRTGSGKSTLFQAVYRFVQYEAGEILIDGRSIRDYSIENLRKSMAVIPQDPSLFMGTLRSNLDRYGEKTDLEILDVLEKVGLMPFFRELQEGLNYHITENGSNLSQGQRQLVCLARALLMKVKIIFLDEATASVDIETDAAIQKVIHEYLEGITLVTIAHRLSTLKGYDQIIELQSGRVI